MGASNKKKPRVAPWIALGVAIVLGLFVGLLATSKGGKEGPHSALIDKAAPAITGTGFRGDSFDLDAQRGRWVVVNFFSTTCVPCQLEHPELEAWAQEHAKTGDASIVSVTFDDKPSAVQAFFEQNGGNWPVLLDNTGPVAIAYGVTAVPESYLVDPFGIVRAKITGGITATKLDELLARYGA
jgi:cytochrome c biogenesis protein CcmG/thiol:disulfide interchange protein DsbE